MAGTVVVAVVLARFLLPLLIPRFPLPAVVACLVVDAADQTIFVKAGVQNLDGYQSYDKALDVYYLAIAYVATMRNWRDPVAFQLARFLYLYRLVGVTLFELSGARWILFAFANTFEYVFIAYEAVRTRWNPNRMSPRALVLLVAFIWVCIKLPQEWWIHIAQLDFTDFMAAHPWAWFVIGGAAIALVVALVVNREKIPAADWPFTMAVDRHLPPLQGETGREPFWSWILLEKVVFVALLTVIFGHALPNVTVDNVRLAGGAATLALLNAAASQAIRRHGHTWAHTTSQFLATFAINVGIVVVAIALSPRASGAPSRLAWFALVLLSMMIALFDRYRATRHDREGFADILKGFHRRPVAA